MMSEIRIKWWHIGILVFVTGILYCRSLGHGFLFEWDDQWMIINEYTENGFTSENLKKILTEFYYGQYSPLNQILYTLIYSIAGYNPMAYHGFCIILHVLNVVIAYLFLTELLSAIYLHGRDISAETRITRKIKIRNAAFIGSLLFAIHPVNVETVSWISASKILVCSFCYLLGLWLYLRYISTKSRLCYLSLLLLFILSFGGKEQAVAFVLSCIAIDYAAHRNQKLSYLALEKLPMMLLALFFGAVTMMSHWYTGSTRMPEYLDWSERILLACYSLFEYLVKAVLPFNLSYIYPFPFQPGERMPLQIFLYPLFVGGMVYVVYHLRRNRLIVFSSLFFVANLVLMLHFIPMARFTVVCDRYLYVALLGPAVLAGWWCVNHFKRYSRWVMMALCPYMLYLAAVTYSYQGQWRDSESLKMDIRKLLQERDDIREIHKLRLP